MAARTRSKALSKRTGSAWLRFLDYQAERQLWREDGVRCDDVVSFLLPIVMAL